MAPASPVVAVRQGYWRSVFRRLLPRSRRPDRPGTLILLLLALALFGPWLMVKDHIRLRCFYALNLSAATVLFWF